MADKRKIFCMKCNKTKVEDKFYSTRNLEKYPQGKLDICKDCITMHVNNFEPETYLWILQEIDIPYVEDIWNKILISYKDQPDKLTGMTIMGRYLSQMKLNQWKTKRWADTNSIAAERRENARKALLKKGYSEEEVNQKFSELPALENISLPPPTETVESFLNKNEAGDMREAVASLKEEMRLRAEKAEEEITSGAFDLDAGVPADILAELRAQATQPGVGDPYGPNYFEDDLTEEDRKYLSLKWGRQYTPEEWVRLEQLYTDMFNSFDIQNAGHVDTLKLICKTSLKTHQLLDMGDIEGAKKTQSMYDSLMKSGKFTALQNKTESGDDIDSVGELVAMCEKQGFIPRYATDIPQDKVDRTLADLKQYTKTLIVEELNLGNLIENAIRQMQKQEEFEQKLEDDTDDANEAILAQDELTDQDFQDFYDLMSEEEEDEDE